MNSNGSSFPKTSDSWLERIKFVFGLSETSTLREDLANALREAHDTDEFSPKERSILANVLKVGKMRVSDVMKPRSHIVAVSAAASLAEVYAVFRSSSYARLPVYAETLDALKGMIHIRDFVHYLAGPDGDSLLSDVSERMPTPLSELALTRPLLFFPSTMRILDSLVRMQTSRIHMAIIVNEYGETDGLATIEDLVEVILGDIEDEHDIPEVWRPEIQGDGSIVVSADTPLEDVMAMLEYSWPIDAAVDVSTIGGFVAAFAGYVPQKGEILKGPSGVVFEVQEAEPRRIIKLKVKRAPEENPLASDEESPPASTRQNNDKNL